MTNAQCDDRERYHQHYGKWKLAVGSGGPSDEQEHELSHAAKMVEKRLLSLWTVSPRIKT